MRKLLLASAGFVLFAGTSVLAADLPVKAPVYKAPPPPPVFSWTGFYVGGNVGYSWGRASTDLTETVTSTATITTLAGTPIASSTVTTTSVGSDRARLNGALGGFQAGYNWQFDHFVTGFEGDIQATGQRGDITICPVPAGAAPVPCPGTTGTLFGAASYRLPWFGTLRGRVGVTFDRILLYATGGLAVGEIKADYVDGTVGGTPLNPLATGSVSTTRAGWVFGGGIEGAIDRNWSIKAEYLHLDFGSLDQSISASGVSLTIPLGDFRTTLSQSLTSTFHTRVTDDVFRIGVNYRFGGPVVANY
jgi:outer membrane immunogenic protein